MFQCYIHKYILPQSGVSRNVELLGYECIQKRIYYKELRNWFIWSQKLASPNLQCGLTAWRPRKAHGVLQVQRPAGGDPGYMIVEDIGRQSAGESCLHKETSLFCSIQVFQFHGGSDSKESACKCRRPRFDPQVGKIPWRREWQPTPILLPGEFPGQRSLDRGVSVTQGSQKVRHD